jgi:hypothetical protein
VIDAYLAHLRSCDALAAVEDGADCAGSYEIREASDHAASALMQVFRFGDKGPGSWR